MPTGSATPDHYDGHSVVALEAKTGKLVWGFQTVHHDIGDSDVASQPEPYIVKGKATVAVGSKTGRVFLLHRATGKPGRTRKRCGNRVGQPRHRLSRARGPVAERGELHPAIA